MGRASASLLRKDGVEVLWELYEGDVSEIAKEYNLSHTSVYRIMREYCVKNNRIYSSFLRFPHKAHVLRKGRVLIKKGTIPKAHRSQKGKFKIKKIPLALKQKNDFSYVSELFESEKSSDVIYGIELLEEMIQDILNVDKEKK